MTRWLQSFAAPFIALGGVLGNASRRTVGLSLAYVVLAMIILAAVAALIDAFGGGFRRWLQVILFPGELQPFAELAIDVVFRTQSRTLTANLTAAAGLVVVSILLFFVKEALSRAVEADLGRTRPPPPDDATHDFPWWREGLEEIGLVLVYAALFVAVFALGQTVNPWQRDLAIVVSWVVLFWTWAVDFIAPALFRRRIPYRGVFRLIARHPLASLTFGAFVSLPVVGTAALLEHLDASSATRMLTTVVVQAVFIVIATWVGTRMTLLLHWDATVEKRVVLQRSLHPVVRVATVFAIAGVLGFGLHVGTGLARALVEKSQILKCAWSLETGSVALDLPDPDPVGWLTGQPVTVGFSALLTVHNPTPVDVAIEPTRVELSEGSHRIASTTLAPMRVAAGERKRERIQLQLSLNPDVFLKGASLDPTRWALQLWLKLENGLDFPVPLVVPSR